MRIKIASRKSDLARIQAQKVASLLRLVQADLEIEHLYTASFGDQNPDVNLWEMPEKGVFTEDFRQGLCGGEFDFVVHSWKDLPTNLPESSEIMTIKRADPRDLILFKKDCLKKDDLEIYTSSPRRVFHLDHFIKNFFPKNIDSIECLPIRGNIPTRLMKYLNDDVQAIVVAKAAIDRILETTSEEFREAREMIRNVINQSKWMITPISDFPTAAAQGALAIEYNKDNTAIKNLLKKIHDAETFDHVKKERDTLRSFGGGCHLKIGVNSISHDRGSYFSISGETPKGEMLKKIEFIPNEIHSWPTPSNEDELFPSKVSEQGFFNRKLIDAKLENQSLWFTRFFDHPALEDIKDDQLIWCAGTKTWGQLADKGIWCHGTNESLGDHINEDIDLIAGNTVSWKYLTHTKSMERNNNLSYYELIEKENIPSLEKHKFFFWMSGTQFELAKKITPKIVDGYHASGPGQTFNLLEEHIPRERLKVYHSYYTWLEEMKDQLKDQSNA